MTTPVTSRPGLTPGPHHDHVTSYDVNADSNTPNLSYASYEHTRKVVEFCCLRNSRVGQLCPKQCQIHRLTIDNNLRSNQGLKEAFRAISNNKIPTLLWASIPCTGGCPYVLTHIALAHKHNRPQTIENIDGHIEDFENVAKLYESCQQAHCPGG